MANSKETFWYIPDRDGGLSPSGPYDFNKITRMIRAGELRVDEFVWGSHFVDGGWLRIFDCEEFKEFLLRSPVNQVPKKRSSGLSKNYQSLPDSNTTSFRRVESRNQYRRYPRADILSLIHI